MLEQIIIRNFKRFDEVEVELGSSVVFIGPNNSGKTSALQALALWALGARRWHEKRGIGSASKSRSGVAINRTDLVTIPIPEANLLWRDLHVRRVERLGEKQKTRNIRIEIEVHGVTKGQMWACPLEFDFANSESLYCRPLGWAAGQRLDQPAVPPEALQVQVAYLPPMSGLAAREDRLDPGAVQVRLGEGRTAEVLRNLCHQLHTGEALRHQWPVLVERVHSLFGVTLEAPVYVKERGEITMAFEDEKGIRLDLSASGRGLQQTILLLAYILQNPGALLLLDEPDAHLEFLRQRQTYGVLTELAQEQGCQVVAASHSEVVLNEAANRDVVVAFVGKPHRIDDRGRQVVKALREIGFDQYLQAEQCGWVLYLEGSTDLTILRELARKLDHPAQRALARPFVKDIVNQPKLAEAHFHGLREAKRDLVGIALLDRPDRSLPESSAGLTFMAWRRREIENYLCFPEVLIAYARSLGPREAAGPLFEGEQGQQLADLMGRLVQEEVAPAALRDRQHSWWSNVKASDDFLDRVFERFFAERNLPNLMRKTNFHELARFCPVELIDPEVREKLDAILEVAQRARPLQP